MDETSDNPGQGKASALLRTLRPAMPAVIGAAVLTFLFAVVMPMSWVAGIGWNLYLDRLSDYFVPPVGNAGRLVLALGMAAIASLIAGLVALLIAQPEAAGLSSLRGRFRRESTADADEDSDAFWTRRRRVDLHPDDPVRPPIRAGRDLPAGGLGPLNADVEAAEHSAEADLWLDEFAEQNADELVLADLAPEEVVVGDEPWLQPAEMTAPLPPAATDHSLGAMVARLEAGLALRRRSPGVLAATPAIPVPEGGAADLEPEVDFALEAALSTLQRMTRQSVG
ncbi:MAG: hypothetical protein JHD35_15700 [Sphingopyxis sp.]|nr:hypothetical protein [Sphingopyxis sp.]